MPSKGRLKILLNFWPKTPARRPAYALIRHFLFFSVIFTMDVAQVLVGNVGVNLGGHYAGVAEERLHRA